MSPRSVPGFKALVKVGSPKTNGASPSAQAESSKPGCRQASTGAEASANPLMNFQAEFVCTSTVRVSRVKLQRALAFVPLNALGTSARSAMPWLVAQVMLIGPEGGCGTLKT